MNPLRLDINQIGCLTPPGYTAQDQTRHSTGMKKFIYSTLLALGFAFMPFVVEANVRITPASGGNNILADVAGDSVSPAWTTLGPISIVERKKGDILAGNNVTLILTAPKGFEFNTAVAPNVSYTANRDISAAVATVVNPLTLRVTFTVTGNSGLDTLTIGSTQGLQVRASAMVPLARGNIVRPSGAAGGTAVFSGLRPSKAKFGSLVEVAGVATKLGFQVQPSTNVVVGTVFGQKPIIAVMDNGNNVRSADNGRVVTASLSSGPGSLSGTLTAITVNGLATFTNLSLSDPGEVTLTFSTSNLTSAVSAPITVFPGPPPPSVATSLSVQVQPSLLNLAGASFAQQPVVIILDQYDFPFTNENSAIITASNVDTNDLLQGTLSVQVVNGVATFTNLFHTNATDLTIRFTSTNLNAALSDVITINPAAASRLVFDVQPDLAAVGKPFAIQPLVITQDMFGNDSDSGLPSSLNVTMTLTSGTGTLGGTTVLDIGTNDGSGAITFTDLSISTEGVKQLTASAAGLSNAVSDFFSVLPKTNQTITFFADIPAKVYGDGAFTVTATASSGLPVTFSIVSGPATNSGNLVTITGAGTVVVRASQSGNVDYLATPNLDQTFSVARRPLTATADNASRNYGDANPTFTGSITGVTNSDSITASFSSLATLGSLPGTYAITVTLNDPNGRIENYLVTKQNGTLTVNGVPPSITTQPQGQTANQGTPVTLTVGATGSLLSYQWRLNGTNVAGATASALTFGSVQSANEGTYSVVVTNGS
ncbi:MAG: regulator of chromosome condensation, partial [Verrucomicrobiales bacterium]|nr:regulator of chromosome condensation [Verrucomicrobiales bacterium]